MQPTETTGQYSGSFYPTDQPPFAPGPLLAKQVRANANVKLFLSNGSQEYWGRAAALNHVTEDGKDLDHARERSYLLRRGNAARWGWRGRERECAERLTNSMEMDLFPAGDPHLAKRVGVTQHAPPASVYPSVR